MLKKLLYLSNLTFLALYIVLAWHNRLTLDDFHFMDNVHKYGILKGIEVEYNFYSTRWLSVLIVHTTLFLMPYVNALFILGIVTIIAVTISFSYFIKNISYRFLSFQPGKLLLLNLGIFSANALFYSSMDIGNIWFWLSDVPTYLWSFTFFTAGCGIIITGNKFPVIKFSILSLSFFYIGGSAEAFAAVVLLVLLIIAVWLYFFKPSLPDRKIYLTRLYIAFFFCLGSLIILYLGHGNDVRRELIGRISLTRAFILNIETTGWIGIYWISRIVPLVLLFSIPLLYVGKILSGKNLVLKESLSEVIKNLFKATLFYGLLILIINYPITYLLCGIAPARALLPVSFLTWALFAFSFFYIGYKIAISDRIARNSIAIAFSLCIIVNTYNAIHQFVITKEYALKYDALMEELTTKKNNYSLIAVSPLPQSGMLTPLELSPDSLANNNMFIKNALELKPYIKLTK